MKIALLGLNPFSLKIGASLQAKGAFVRIFAGSMEEKEKFFRELDEGMAENTKHFIQSSAIAPFYWSRVHKQYLGRAQNVPGKTRFFDLFRIIYQVDGEQLSQLSATEKEAFSLPQEFLDHLQTSLEMFEDFDVVINNSSRLPYPWLGSAAPAIGECHLPAEKKWIGFEENKWKERLAQHPPQQLVLVGSGECAVHALLALQAWLASAAGHKITVITDEKEAFREYLSTPVRLTALQTQKDFLSWFENWQKEEMRKDLRCLEEQKKWSMLEDYIKAKVPYPTRDPSQIEIFSCSRILSFDQLMDQQKIYVTVETIPWLSVNTDSSQNLKTIGVDLVVGVCGKRMDTSKIFGLQCQYTLDGKYPLNDKGLQPERGYIDNPGGNFLTEEEIGKHLEELFSPRTNQTENL
jgi:hypothetical protein